MCEDFRGCTRRRVRFLIWDNAAREDADGNLSIRGSRRLIVGLSQIELSVSCAELTESRTCVPTQVVAVAGVKTSRKRRNNEDLRRDSYVR